MGVATGLPWVLGKASPPDPTTLERAVWVLATAVLGLLIREVWQAWRARQKGRARDRIILSALLREVAAIQGLANGMLRDVEREAALATKGRLRLKPLSLLPTTVYELVKGHAPSALLEDDTAFSDLIVLQAQCGYTNLLAAEQRS